METEKLLTEAELAQIQLVTKLNKKAALTGIAGARAFGIRTLSPLRTIDLALPGGSKPPPRSQWRPGVRFHTAARHSIPFNSPQRLRTMPFHQSLLHIQRTYGTLETLVAVDSARRLYPDLTREKLHAWIEPYAGAKGIRELRKTIDLSEPTMDSPMETVARYHLLQANLPEIKSIEYQAKIEVVLPNGFRRRFYVDQLINGFLISELDGKTKYNGTYGDIPADVIQKERDRERLLLNAGYSIVRNYYAALRVDEQGTSAYVRSIRAALNRHPATRRPLPRTAHK